MKSLSDKDEIMNHLSNRLKYLACDVGERERKLNSEKAKYLSESREYQNSQKRRANRNRNAFIMANRHYQFPAQYNSLGVWPGARGGYPRGASYAHSYGFTRRHPRDMSATPWNMPPLQNWNHHIPNRKPGRRRTIPGSEWAVCWNFNSARGCPRGTSCPWRHQKYSTPGNETNDGPRGDSNGNPSTSNGQSRREVVQVQSRSHQKEGHEIENKKQENGATEVACQTSISSNPPPVQWSPNIKTRDIDTDSKEERSQEETPTDVKYGYNGCEPPENDSEESGVE